MEIGDRVKVARLDQYTLDVIMATNAKSPIGMTGTIIEKYYNHNMRRDEVGVEADGTWDKWIWTPWNLDIICGH